MSFEAEEQVPMGSIGEVHELGLCYTCVTVKTCTGRKTWVGPVLHCEEFSDTQGVPHSPVREAASPVVGNSVPTEEKASPRSGLCVNCAHRHSCGFPVAEGGTWHCEEYE